MTNAKLVPVEPVNAAHAAYGALWCMTTANPIIKAARQHLLAAIGGQRSEGQRAAIQWAAANIVPPSDQEIAAIDVSPMDAPVVGEPDADDLAAMDDFVKHHGGWPYTDAWSRLRQALAQIKGGA